ncbi:MAG: tetratricopeptide repeat protein, partial [Chitinophagales bacterium]
MKPSLNHQEATPLFEEAKLLFDKEQYQAAMEILPNVFKIFEEQQNWTGFLQAQIQFSNCCFRCKLYEKGIEAFEKNQKKVFPYFEENHVLVGKSHLEMGKNCRQANQLEKAKQHSLTAIQILQNQANPNQLDLADGQEILAFYYGQLGDHKSQKQYYEKALNLRLTAKVIEPKSISNTYESLAFANQRLNLLDEMLESLNCSLAVLQKEFGVDHPNTAKIYFKIGFYYSMKGDIDQALAFTHKSLNLLLKTTDTHLKIISNCYNALGFLVGEKGDHEQQLTHFLQERATLRKLYTSKELKRELINNSSNIAYSYTQRGLHTEALTYLEETLVYCKEIHGENHRQTIRIQDNIGVVLLKSNKLKEGYDHIQKALQKSLALYGNKHYRVFHAYHHLGDYYLMISDTLQQIKAYQKAIIALVADFHAEDHHQNPVLPLHQPHPIELSKVLSKKATSLVLWYQSTQDPKDLRTAIATYKLSLDFIQQMRQNHQAEGSKLFSSKVMMHTFENAIHATHQLIEATKNMEEKKALRNTFFQFSEHSKAALLLSNVKESEAKTSAAIPADLLEEEQNIKQELNELQKKINQQKAKGVGVTDSILLGLQGAYFDLQQIYQQVIQNFETNYPAYFQLKYNIKMVKTADINNHLQQKNQQNLQYKTAVVSYLKKKKNIYALLFTD